MPIKREREREREREKEEKGKKKERVVLPGFRKCCFSFPF
jgi:hypothetical protein